MGETPGLRGVVLILVQAILLPGTFIITYFMATSAGHVEEEFPYISDTGTYAPESGVFGILLALYSIAAFLSVYVRWHLVSEHYTGRRAINMINNIALVLGILAAVGALLVACFQETSQLTMHLIGAFMAFVLVCAYMWLHAGLTHLVATLPGHTRLLFYLRLGLAAATTISFIGSSSLAVVAEGNKPANHTRTSEPGTGKWYSWMEGYDIHVTSASFEWALAGCVSVYFLTFISEFRHVTVGMPQVYTMSSMAKD